MMFDFTFFLLTLTLLALFAGVCISIFVIFMHRWALLRGAATVVGMVLLAALITLLVGVLTGA